MYHFYAKKMTMSSLHEQLLQDWFTNHDWWFSKNVVNDEIIKAKYISLLDEGEDVIQNIEPLTKIIMYDQLPHHIYRSESAAHIISYFLQKAINILQNTSKEYIDTLPCIQWTFFMLPYRHQRNASSICYVVQETWKKIKETDNIDDDRNEYRLQVYRRFLKATYNHFIIDCRDQTSMIDSCCETEVSTSDFEDILEFKGRYTAIYTNILPKKSSQITLPSTITTMLDDAHIIVLSLSGGVDSMVCSYLLSTYCKGNNIVAVHVNYDNRRNSHKEVLFLKDWCAKLKMPLYIRKIDEIHRDDCMKYELRELYERYTRDVRYNTYKSVANTATPKVILGHNKDDCLENIFTNICQKTKFDNLCGMSFYCVQDGIQFIRPLINIAKKDIIAFARANEIPFLTDNTPPWSQRGQIRNSIVPCLDKWDKRFIPSLFVLNDTMKSLCSIMQDTIQSVIDNGTLERTSSCYKFVFENDVKYLHHEPIFWREIFWRLLNLHVPIKSLGNLRGCIIKYKDNFHNIGLADTRKIMICKDCVFEILKMTDTKVRLTTTLVV